MPSVSFQPDDLRRGLGFAKIVKPESGDLHVRFGEQSLTVWSHDGRRQVLAFVTPSSIGTMAEGVESDWTSDEFYVPFEKSVLFETDLSAVTISVNEKSFSVHASGGGVNRRASLKKRAESSRRPRIPAPPDVTFSPLGRKHFDELLRQVSCSAMIRETKTEEDMRVNQVHFHPELGCVSSNARYYASLAFLPGLAMDLSLVSSDIPFVRAFCARCQRDEILLAQDKSRVCVKDPGTGSVMTLNKVLPRRSPAIALSPDGFTIEVRADREALTKSLGWASTAIEGTQRLGIRASAAEGVMKMMSGMQELSSMPIDFRSGDSLSADFPVRIFASIVGFLEGEVMMRFGHKEHPSILELSSPSDGSVRAVHYLMSMKERH